MKILDHEQKEPILTQMIHKISLKHSRFEAELGLNLLMSILIRSSES